MNNFIKVFREFQQIQPVAKGFRKSQLTVQITKMATEKVTY